jgi:hypothetical protein
MSTANSLYSQALHPKRDDLSYYLSTSGSTFQFQYQEPRMHGDRYVVICDGKAHEVNEAGEAGLKQAKENAEALAHKCQSPAYILKPVLKVAPKRDVVTTEL